MKILTSKCENFDKKMWKFLQENIKIWTIKYQKKNFGKKMSIMDKIIGAEILESQLGHIFPVS